jgi:hypothetical protein
VRRFTAAVDNEDGGYLIAAAVFNGGIGVQLL